MTKVNVLSSDRAKSSVRRDKCGTNVDPCVRKHAPIHRQCVPTNVMRHANVQMAKSIMKLANVSMSIPVAAPREKCSHVFSSSVTTLNPLVKNHGPSATLLTIAIWMKTYTFNNAFAISGMDSTVMPRGFASMQMNVSPLNVKSQTRNILAVQMDVVHFVTRRLHVICYHSAHRDVNARTDTWKGLVDAFHPTCATLVQRTKSGRHALVMERAKSPSVPWCLGKRIAKFRLGANLAVNVASRWSDIMASALSRRNAALLVLAVIMRYGTTVDLM